MAVINPAVTWAKLEARLAAETDPVRRHNLQMIITHSKAELAGDIDATVATLSEDVEYHTYGSDDPTWNPKGKPQVAAYYDKMKKNDALRLQMDCDRLVVDRHCVLTEGVLRIAYTGRMLQGIGITVDDLDADYLFEARIATLWPFDDRGLILGEHNYMGGDGFAGIASRKLRPGDILTAPPYNRE